jgi:hypothetical protein
MDIDNKNIEQLRVEQIAKGETAPISHLGLMSTLESLLKDANIDKARKMFDCHQDEALKAITEYEPSKHKINDRPDKKRAELADYPTCKLTCAIQKRVNSVSTHFMFGNKLKFSIANKSNEVESVREFFDIFIEYIETHYFHEKMYEARQITGAETECAKLYSLYKDSDGNTEVICQLKSNSNGDILYPLFNQYGKMVAFGLGYFLRDGELKPEEHFDVYTSKKIWKFKRATIGSDNSWVEESCENNPFKKIPVIYYRHEVDWEGSQPNIERLEWIVSKNGDTNEYFGNPYLLISPDIADERLADAREVGKVMVTDKEGRFEFVAPPECGDMIENEKNDLNASIERDTLTPDWTYKSIMGLGTLSAKAMRQINISGYVKRNRLAIKIYNELIRREINLIVAILCNYEYLDNTKIQNGLKRLKIGFSFTDPFVGSLDDNSTEISTFVGASAMSIHSAVAANPYVEDKEAEEERIWKEIERRAMIEAKAKADAAKAVSEENKEDEDKNKPNKTEE